MGICIMRLSGASSRDRRIDVNTDTTPNPNPYAYTILHTEREGQYVVMKVQYPHCTTYEGVKILVVDITKLWNDGGLDPHFTENGPVLARFEPNDRGMKGARALVKALNQDQ